MHELNLDFLWSICLVYTRDLGCSQSGRIDHDITMRALRYYGNRDLRVDDIAEPKCAPGFVKIRVAWCGICGSDTGEYHSGPAIWGKQPHILTGEGEVPYCMGHEMSGTVAELGEGVNDLGIGSKVVVEPLINCEECVACKSGAANLCVIRGFHGFSGWGGGLSEYMCCKRKSVFPIAEHLSLDVAALVEPLAVGWNAVSLAPPSPDQTVLITGAGPVGLAVLLAIKAKNHSTKVLVSAPVSTRSQLALDFGAAEILDPKKTDIVEAVKSKTNGMGVDISVECSGNGVALPIAIQSLRPGGTIINTSVYMKGGIVDLDPNTLTRRGLVYRGSMGYFPGCFQEVINALADGSIPVKMVKRLISSRISLDDTEELGFKAILDRRPGTVKILVAPSGLKAL